MKIILVLLLLLTLPILAHADNYLDINVGCYHWDRQAVKEYNFNENNFGIAYEHDNGNFLETIGYYNNSLRVNSDYALVGYEPIKLGSVKLGVIGGVITGYKYKSAPFVPAIGAIATYNTSFGGINLIATPNYKSMGVYGFLGLQLKIKF